jgi:hypothetical protein
MKIISVTCEGCGTAYCGAVSEAVESASLKFECSVCGKTMQSADGRNFGLIRLSDRPQVPEHIFH